MNTQKIKDYLADELVKQGYDKSKFDDSWYEETLIEANTVYEGSHDQHRWIIYFERVVKVGDKFFSFPDATCTGDGDLSDMGYEWNWDEVTEVFPVEVMTIQYKEKF